jgi:hypothetical protein
MVAACAAGFPLQTERFQRQLRRRRASTLLIMLYGYYAVLRGAGLSSLRDYSQKRRILFRREGDGDGASLTLTRHTRDCACFLPSPPCVSPVPNDPVAPPLSHPTRRRRWRARVCPRQHPSVRGRSRGPPSHPGSRAAISPSSFVHLALSMFSLPFPARVRDGHGRPSVHRGRSNWTRRQPSRTYRTMCFHP